MSYPHGGGGGGGESVEFCPTRTDLHWSQAQYDRVEFADFNQVQVAQYGEVKFFQQPPDSEDENLNGEGESFFFHFGCRFFGVVHGAVKRGET
ncbi:hypothetical protein C8A01DRAFT_14491 [Parachaetomium inaequale]|uniref:Uncharacterized protein n=1 Tax=Parachaetomium inaequale TaxID=2588326 RepID=A0AAN6PIV1_9PEZI|nr:hypothetical protein C8A01DRAFT_14491 [Parachaetomium inaequale]